jgi:tetratricopeptide (TPR) repeat protein
MDNSTRLMLEKAITDLALDSENPLINYKLGILYESIGQTASAITYFYRAAERSNIKELIYECLLKSGLCYERQGNRQDTVKRMYQHALYVFPKRPEAYFLMSRIYERTQKYMDGYTMASIGLEVADFNLKPLLSNVEYPGKYGLIFEKAVCGWWWGKNMESRTLLRHLADDYHNKMDQIHTDAVYNNIYKLGIGPESVTHKHYNKSRYNELRHKFKGAENINNSHGQVFQDIWVLSMLDGKQNGTYLEIGSAGPFYGNNTALLEQDYNWTGVGVDYDVNFVNEYTKQRKNPVLHTNALTLNYEQILSDLAVDGVVDYLQLDCEPSSITYEIMTKIPFDKFKFRTITYEHDHYQDRTKSYRQKSREYLLSKGYVLVANDISPEGGSSFEDWYAHPDLIDAEILEKMISVDNRVKNAEHYMFPGNIK